MKCNYCLLLNRIQKYEKIYVYEIAKIKLNCTATENTLMTNTTDTNERRPDSRLTRNKKRQHKKPKNTNHRTENNNNIETKEKCSELQIGWSLGKHRPNHVSVSCNVINERAVQPWPATYYISIVTYEKIRKVYVHRRFIQCTFVHSFIVFFIWAVCLGFVRLFFFSFHCIVIASLELDFKLHNFCFLWSYFIWYGSIERKIMKIMEKDKIAKGIWTLVDHNDSIELREQNTYLKWVPTICYYNK